MMHLIRGLIWILFSFVLAFFVLSFLAFAAIAGLLIAMSLFAARRMGLWGPRRKNAQRDARVHGPFMRFWRWSGAPDPQDNIGGEAGRRAYSARSSMTSTVGSGPSAAQSERPDSAIIEARHTPEGWVVDPTLS